VSGEPVTGGEIGSIGKGGLGQKAKGTKKKNRKN
jgi:hypothetical protein